MKRNGKEYKTPRERFKDYVLALLEEHRAAWSEPFEHPGTELSWEVPFREGAQSEIDWLKEMIKPELGIEKIETLRLPTEGGPE